jgi:hypothetical protein
MSLRALFAKQSPFGQEILFDEICPFNEGVASTGERRLATTYNSTCGREAVKSVLRLFDELVKCDEEGVLKDVREVIEGK